MLLALDTTAQRSSVALFDSEGNLLDCASHIEDREHVKCLVVLIELILSRNQRWYSDLKYMAVTVGPGSFTGIRIGIAAAMALECVSIQLVGVNNIDIYRISNANSVVVLSASRNAFLLHDSEGLEYVALNGLHDKLSSKYYEAIYGDCHDILAGYATYCRLEEKVAVRCGMIAMDMISRNDIVYPKAQYIPINISKF